jgi:heptosyltransferase II
VRILVRVPNWVGDAVLCLPALEALRRCWPQATICILGRQLILELYAHQDVAQEFVAYDQSSAHAAAARRPGLLDDLRGRFDTAVLFQNAFEAAWLVWRAGIAERIGYARDGRGWLLTQSIPTPKPGETPAHECYYYLELLRRAGWLRQLESVREIRLRVSEGARQQAEQKLSAAGLRAGRLRLAIAAGAAYGTAKCWPAERYAALASRFIDEFAADVILFGAPAEIGVAQRIAAAMRRGPLNLVGQTSMGELPALLSACHLFIGNDSGAMHLAAAVGLPVVGIFGSSDPQGTAPVTPTFQLVRHAVECSPCFLRTCPIDHRCMTRIRVEDAWAAAEPWARPWSGGELA